MSIKLEDEIRSLKKSLYESTIVFKENHDNYGSLFKALFINSIPTILYFLSSIFILIITLHFVGIYSENTPDSAFLIGGLGVGSTLLTFATSGIIIGLNLGLIALSSQAYGAKDHRLVGLYFHRALLINTIIISLLSIILLFTQPILQSLGIPEQTSLYAAEYLKRIFGGIFAYMLVDTMKAYLISQGLFLPQLTVQLILVVVHWISCQYFIIHLNLGIAGGAWAYTLTYTIGAILLFSYIMIFKPRKKSWFFFQKESFVGLFSLFLKELPIGSMLYLESIAFEITVIMAGVYQPIQSASQIAYYNISGPYFYIPFALSTTLNSFTGQAMGEKNYMKAKRVLCCALIICLIIIILSELSLIYFTYNMLEFFTNDESIISVAQNIMVIYYYTLPQDYIQTQLGGFIRGIGQEKLGLWGFIICYYCLGLPCAYILGTILHYNVIGIRIGIGIGTTVALIFNSIIIYKTDFDKQVLLIDERLIQDKLLHEKEDQIGNELQKDIQIQNQSSI